ncbi:PolC-type DNA polymerase III [Peptoniphilus sp. MSJ-1]|uniref:DNA polymerase III PolC-type n=1 Tax=Peptoniphilus ovalis TaxID=2841503 RepID=A0ABS6FIL3_9FIRM|nr:PolC-type DNA polymerase III [Peptoniphilus ovalis]MBU5669076.1 PolC-type DNA polymerase III [Peptoniphilus ovalis]
MILLKDILNKLSINNLKIDDKVEIKSIKRNKSKMEVLIKIDSKTHLDDFKKNEICKIFSNNFNDYKINIEFLESSLYESEDSLIYEEILKYNPSSKAWINDLEISKDLNLKKLILKIPSQEAFYSLTRNGFKNHLIEKLKIFGEYNVEILCENESQNETCIDDYLVEIEKEEQDIYIRQKTEAQKNISKAKTESENNEISSYGRKDIDNITNLAQMDLNSQKITVEVDIFNVECRELKNKNFLVSLSVTDYTSSTLAKIFLKPEKCKEFLNSFKNGDHVLITGKVSYDNYSRCETIMIGYIEKREKLYKLDNDEEKRVEFRIHSKMSQMSGVTSFDDFANRANMWGNKALAITDTNDVQGFPEAMDAAKKYGLKILYGADINFVDDTEKIVTYYDSNKEYNTYVVFDIETTGLSSRNDKITEIGAVKIENGIITDRFSELINPEIPIPEVVVNLTGISNELVSDKPTIEDIIPKFYEFSKDAVLVAHNAKFDISFIRREYKNNNLEFNHPILDTLVMARALLCDLKRFNLGTLCKNLGISLVGAHRAVNDAEATAAMFIKLIEKFKKDKEFNFDNLNEEIKNIHSERLFENSLLLIVKNITGLTNLYKLISASHMKFYNFTAKVPRTLLDNYREGILIGSGNSSSELFDAIFRNVPQEELERIANYYDFLEIQPVMDNILSIQDGKYTIEDIKDINKKIVEIGEKLNIPVIADSDTYYLDEIDDIKRRIVLNGKPGRPDSRAFREQKLYFKTTEEMLKEFSYLGEEKSYEVVVENTNKIAESLDDIKPIPDGTFPPVIEGSDEDLKQMTFKKAHEIYGENLPQIVEERLQKELDSIISNGYAVLYIIAQKLVKKSNDDGFLVGSRGSVGSSFVATMSGITEVNPLPPHYVCPNCKHSEFTEDLKYGSGVDMPEKDCPECGTPLRKDGHNIPFEVFLGFYGDKEPDIDLNFAGEYQPEAHKYTEELFGEGYVFRAGTIGTIAEKTAYGYVKKYFENKNISPVEVDRLSKSIIGVKRTSGQHPGGVMIVPKSKSIFDFTPIQYPADDPSSGVITTHFDYNFIHGKILKLDILGHDGPTIIKMLEDFTGTNANDVKLDDKETLSIFNSSDALNLDKEIFDTDTGTLGIPEFGTGFVISMLKETKPKNFADLVRISGLSHGTDVWLSNAQELVNSGRAELSDVIATREDIMVYLINAGAENKMAFDTMEKVRKGKGLTPEQEEIMNNLDLPEWYIDSCKKIKYMFPKAHAVAYVMLSFRIAYYKLNYPLAFYATHFSIKLSDFNGEIILEGPRFLKNRLEALSQIEKPTQKDKGEINVNRVALEMYARGFEFLAPDLYKSKASKFTIEDGKIRMPLRAIPGIGENCANLIEEEAEKSKFLSIEDFSKRTKSGNSVISILQKNGLLNNLDETNQISLFNL